MHTHLLGEKMWMFSTADWSPQAELHTLATKADSLSPGEVKAKLLRLAEDGKVCACGSSKNCFALVKNVPARSSFGDMQYCGLVTSAATDE